MEGYEFCGPMTLLVDTLPIHQMDRGRHSMTAAPARRIAVPAMSQRSDRRDSIV